MKTRLHPSSRNAVVRFAGLLAVALLLAPANQRASSAALPMQSGDTYTVAGYMGRQDQTGGYYFIRLTFDFDPRGGSVNGQFEGSDSWSGDFSGWRECQYSGTLTGYYEGGDGGAIGGTFSGRSILREYPEASPYSETTGEFSGIWEGKLGREYSIEGTDNYGSKASVTVLSSGPCASRLAPKAQMYMDFPGEAFPAGSPAMPPGAALPPEIAALQQEAIDQITNLVASPAVPLAGAIAGTALAALLAALRGAGSVPISANTAVRGGPKPGAVDANGRLYSPVSGGWVSPQMYEYQKTWSEKGWRWNASSGKFEGQHGAINEKGQVMDDELGWVDQDTFAENQRMRAGGNVYDRNLGWRPPEELRDRDIEQNALRQRSRQFSAEQNAQIQQDVRAASQERMQEYQDWLKQYEHKEQVRLDMDAAQDEFRRQRAIDNKLALKEFLLNAAASPVNAPDAIASRLCPTVGEVYQGAYDGVKEAASDIKEFYKDAYQGLKETAGDIKDFYQAEIKDGYDAVKDTAADIKDFYKGTYDELKETAGDIKDFYQGEIRDTYDGVKDAAGDVKDLVIHDDIHAEWKQAISARNWDWTPSSASADAPAEWIR